MTDETVTKIMKKFARQAIVLGNFMLNYILRKHPELANSDEIRDLRHMLGELSRNEETL